MSHRLPTRVCVRDPEFKNDPTAIYCGRAVQRAKDSRCRADAPFRNIFVVRTGAERRTDPIHRYHVDAALVAIGFATNDFMRKHRNLIIRVDSLDTALNAYSWLLDHYVRREAVSGSDSNTCPALTSMRNLSGKKLGCWCRIGEPCHVDRIIDAFRFWVLKAPLDQTTMREWYTWGSRT